MSDHELTPTEAAEAAAHKAKSAAMATEISREVHQAELVGQTKEALIEALQEVFGKGDDLDPEIRYIPLPPLPVTPPPLGHVLVRSRSNSSRSRLL
jgi:hypothetical protein